MRLSMLRLVLLASTMSAACATAFTGDPHYPGGPRACHANCARQNMEMSSFIYSGEFATSCVCRPRMSPAPVAPPPAAPAAPPAPEPAAGRDDRDVEDAAAAVGVVMQQRRSAQQGNTAGAQQ